MSKSNFVGYLFIALTIAFTIYGQMVLKWQMTGKTLPEGLLPKVLFLAQQYLNPWILSGLVAAFLASMCWIAVTTRFELSFAYPFTSLSFVIAMFLAVLFFKESINLYKVSGTLVILIGLFLITRGS
jgi:drug/metabolite transporter (DMT)-like permease